MSSENCEQCDFSTVKPKAQFMFSTIRKCADCGNIERDEGVEHKGLPRQVRETLEE